MRVAVVSVGSRRIGRPGSSMLSGRCHSKLRPNARCDALADSEGHADRQRRGPAGSCRRPRVDAELAHETFASVVPPSCSLAARQVPTTISGRPSSACRHSIYATGSESLPSVGGKQMFAAGARARPPFFEAAIPALFAASGTKSRKACDHVAGRC